MGKYNYRNKRYFKELETLSSQEIIEILKAEKANEKMFNPSDEVINILTYSGVSFLDMRNHLMAHLPKTNQKGKEVRQTLLEFLCMLEGTTNFGVENENFTTNPHDYEKL